MIREVVIYERGRNAGKEIGVAVFQGENLLALVSKYDFRDTNFDGTVSFTESLLDKFSLYDSGKSAFVSAATRTLIDLYPRDPFFDVHIIRELQVGNFFTVASSLTEWGVKKAWIGQWVSTFGGPILKEIAKGFTENVLSQFILTKIGEEISKIVIGATAVRKPTPVEYSFQFVAHDEADEFFDAYKEISLDENLLIVSQGAGDNIVAGRGNDVVLASSGGASIDLSAGGDNEVTISVFATNQRDNRVVGGGGHDSVTLVAESGWPFYAVLEAEDGSRRFLTAQASFEDVEAFAAQTGPRMIGHGRPDRPNMFSVTTLVNVDAVSYVGGGIDNLMVVSGESARAIGRDSSYSTLYADWRGQSADVTWDLRETQTEAAVLGNGWEVQGIQRVLLRLGDGDHAITAPGWNNTLIGGEGFTRFTGLSGGDTVDLSAGSGSLVTLTASDSNQRDNRLVGGAGHDSVTLMTSNSLPFFAVLEAEDGSRRILTSEASFADVEAFATQTGPRMIGFGRHDQPTSFSITTLESVDAVSYVGSASSDLMVGFGGDEVFRGGAGADVVFGNGGRNTIIGSLAELNGDRILDFTANDVIVVEDAELTAEQIAFSADTGLLTITPYETTDIAYSIGLRGAFDPDRFSVKATDGVSEIRYEGAEDPADEVDDSVLIGGVAFGGDVPGVLRTLQEVVRASLAAGFERALQLLGPAAFEAGLALWRASDARMPGD